MVEKLFLGIDQGSSATKAVLLDMHGQHYQEFSIPIATQQLDAFTVEQDPGEILASVRSIADDAIRAATKLRKHIAAIGFSFQRSGVCAWEAQSGAAVHPLISHRDRRFTSQIESLSEHHSLITEKTGLPPLPNYAAPKIASLQREFPDPKIFISTLDSFIVQQFAGESRFITEDSMASRTMLYSLDGSGWDEELCQIFGVQSSRLPAISSSLGQHGTYRGIPITVLLGDQQASLFSRLAEGTTAVLNLGTGTWVSVFSGGRPIFEPGYVTGVLYSEGSIQRDFKYLLEAVTPASGVIIEFILQKLRAVRQVDEIEHLCRGVSDEKCPIVFAPMGTSGSPDWRGDLPDIVTAWNVSEASELVRGLIENIGNFVAQNIIGLSKLGILTAEHYPLVVSGGLSDLDFLMQHISDCSGVALARLASREASARGAAIASMQHLNRGRTRGSFPRSREIKLFQPSSSQAQQRFERWQELRDKVLKNETPSDWVFSLPE